MPIKDKEEKVLKFIKRFIKRNRYSPSYTEIQEACELSSSSVVKKILDRLVEAGEITYQEQKARSIVISGSRVEFGE